MDSERGTQNHGLEPCIADADSSGKKMFETVDLNASLSNPEIVVKKDISKNSGSLFVKSSEKENILQQEPMDYDEFDDDDDDDDDDNDSLHLRLSESEPETGDCSKKEKKTFDSLVSDINSTSKNDYSEIRETSAGPASQEDCATVEKSSKGDGTVKKSSKGVGTGKKSSKGDGERTEDVKDRKRLFEVVKDKPVELKPKRPKKADVEANNEVDKKRRADQPAHNGVNESKGGSRGEEKVNDVLEKPVEETEKSPDETEKKTEKERRPLLYIRSFKRKMTKMTRNDLEEFVLQKICEAITEHCQAAKYRRKTKELEDMVKLWQKKALQLQQRAAALEMVVRKFRVELAARREEAVPIKLTRSVGLQVGSPSPSLSSSMHSPDVDPLSTAGASDSTEGLSEKWNKNLVTPSTSGTHQAFSVVPIPLSSSPKTVSPSSAKSTDAKVLKDSPGTSRQPLNSQSLAAKPVPARAPMSSPPPVASPKGILRPPAPPPPSSSMSKPPDLKTIDLTEDEDDMKNTDNAPKAVNSTANLPRISNTASATVGHVTSAAGHVTSAAGHVTSAAGHIKSAASKSNAAITANTSTLGRPVRIVQSNGASIFTPAAQNIPGSQVTYLVPASISVQQTEQVHQVHVVQPFQQIQPVQQGRPGPSIMSTAAPVRSAGAVAAASRPAVDSFLGAKGGTLLPITPIQSNANHSFRNAPGGAMQVEAPRPGQQIRLGTALQRMPSVPLPAIAPAPARALVASHPAPLPAAPPALLNPAWKLPPPMPSLKISRMSSQHNKQNKPNVAGVVLTWHMEIPSDCEEIASYQLYAYQESTAAPSTHLWKKIGDVKALRPPMMCTLSQFTEGHKYHFAVRAVDIHARCGPFSAPRHIAL